MLVVRGACAALRRRTLALAVPAGLKGNVPRPTPWKISAKVKADPAAAKLDQIDVSYGAEERALRFSGLADVSFGASPLLHATLSARQLDADRFAAKDSKDTEPLRVVPGLRALIAGIPQSPIPTQIEFSAEQIMLGGRPVQNLTADFTATPGPGASSGWIFARPAGRCCP